MKTMTSLLALGALSFAMVATSVARAENPAPDSYAPDNTGRNVRDREPGRKTADQQSNDATDVRVTQAIRRAVTADDSLSTNAHNVKIITSDGVVKLRGPVRSAAEKASIQAKAEQVAGVKRVENQLEITSR